MNPEGSAPIAPKTTPHAPPAHIKAEHEERHVVSKISFPDFDVDDVDTWFLCLEAAFNVNDVKSDKQKFNTVIVALGNRAKYVYTAIAKCNKSENNDRYITMKNAVLEYFQPSENQRLTNLLSGVSLGDHKPSMLLSEMRRLGGEGCSDSVLLNIWFRALPNTVRSIVSALPTATLDEQAIVADKIMEAPRTEIAPVRREASHTHHTPRTSSDIAALEERIEQLSRRLDEVLSVDRRAAHHKSRSRYTSRSRDRRGQRPTHSSRDHRKPSSSRRWICWYHYRHGAKAEKCEKEKEGDSTIQCIFFEEGIPVQARNKP
ncbi:uncharacterized protein LOC121600513 [Anopheles merus]|uniref:uncharacterized protein LOC121600513 n=1 Tax=Anopheles merus TaxID=30066 RepID=UPI001BE433AF|nr:uncharacterized protein LOC121600513 [Anopheles merus]